MTIQGFLKGCFRLPCGIHIWDPAVRCGINPHPQPTNGDGNGIRVPFARSRLRTRATVFDDDVLMGPPGAEVNCLEVGLAMCTTTCGKKKKEEGIASSLMAIGLMVTLSGWASPRVRVIPVTCAGLDWQWQRRASARTAQELSWGGIEIAVLQQQSLHITLQKK